MRGPIVDRGHGLSVAEKQFWPKQGLKAHAGSGIKLGLETTRTTAHTRWHSHKPDRPMACHSLKLRRCTLHKPPAQQAGFTCLCVCGLTMVHFKHAVGAQVYLQVAQQGGGQDWNTRFSGMMFKVLQDAYVNSLVFSANQDQNVALMGRRLDSPSMPPRVGTL